MFWAQCNSNSTLYKLGFHCDFAWRQATSDVSLENIEGRNLNQHTANIYWLLELQLYIVSHFTTFHHKFVHNKTFTENQVSKQSYFVLKNVFLGIFFFKIESRNFQHLFETESSQNLKSFSSFGQLLFSFFYRLLKFDEISRNSVSNRYRKFQFSILKNKKILFLKNI